MKEALVGQYLAGLAMLRECIETCPDDLWASGQHPRTTWRIAYHALFYTHLYLMPRYEDFVPWDRHQDQATILWLDDDAGVPPEETTYSRAGLLTYLDFLVDRVPGWVEALVLASNESGFYWYSIPKLDHQLLNLRHLSVHVGQFQQILFPAGHDPSWVTRR